MGKNITLKQQVESLNIIVERQHKTITDLRDSKLKTDDTLTGTVIHLRNAEYRLKELMDKETKLLAAIETIEDVSVYGIGFEYNNMTDSEKQIIRILAHVKGLIKEEDPIGRNFNDSNS